MNKKTALKSNKNARIGGCRIAKATKRGVLKELRAERKANTSKLKNLRKQRKSK